MKTFYFTFGQTHPLCDNWIEIQAASSGIARAKMVEEFGTYWSFQYEDADWRPEYFPGGRVGRILEVFEAG